MADINSCTARTLAQIANIPPELARRIVTYRHGKAQIINFDELWYVEGMTRSWNNRIRSKMIIDESALTNEQHQNTGKKPEKGRLSKKSPLSRKAFPARFSKTTQKAERTCKFGSKGILSSESGTETITKIEQTYKGVGSVPIFAMPSPFPTSSTGIRQGDLKLFSPVSVQTSPSGCKIMAVYQTMQAGNKRTNNHFRSSPDKIPKKVQSPNQTKYKCNLKQKVNRGRRLPTNKEMSIKQWLNTMPSVISNAGKLPKYSRKRYRRESASPSKYRNRSQSLSRHRSRSSRDRSKSYSRERSARLNKNGSNSMSRNHSPQTLATLSPVRAFIKKRKVPRPELPLNKPSTSKQMKTTEKDNRCKETSKYKRKTIGKSEEIHHLEREPDDKMERSGVKGGRDTRRKLPSSFIIERPSKRTRSESTSPERFHVKHTRHETKDDENSSILSKSAPSSRVNSAPGRSRRGKHSERGKHSGRSKSNDSSTDGEGRSQSAQRSWSRNTEDRQSLSHSPRDKSSRRNRGHTDPDQPTGCVIL